MAQVWIVAESNPFAEQAIAQLNQAIAQCPTSSTPDTVRVVAPANLPPVVAPEDIFCPLTLVLPEALAFPGASVFRACAQVDSLRQSVADCFGVKPGDGSLWLPIALTAKGPLYGEAIALAAHTPEQYRQPHHLSDRQRQPLYGLAFRLLDWLNAPPAVYLLQVALSDEGVVFDRLWPYPAAGAIASLSVQTPDLFTAHWLCLSHQPLLDLSIPGESAKIL
ncbi:hypothetical protein P7L53_05680 [Thermoleptolyngbya sichuanensis XZ-Cy5]|uniref:hypothetical protein n=1 Tax=Thermoleptolyngbya sichuanensis TaxID=2885951 RepID=UPI00240D6566|nr:hypothetical protein [Thermoleptolyngbya sichuanensis]MDG2615732.1 hypothetical protein [Thermoleptolyngbya sichuanensis XZ-Cy5]